MPVDKDLFLPLHYNLELCCSHFIGHESPEDLIKNEDQGLLAKMEV